jgi:hypothetical protein
MIPTNLSKKSDGEISQDPIQGCQIYLAKTYRNGENIPNYRKIYQKAEKYCQMAIK